MAGHEEPVAALRITIHVLELVVVAVLVLLYLLIKLWRRIQLRPGM